MIRIHVVQADALTWVGLPALVVPANKQLTLGWGTHVAERVQTLAGPLVQQDLLARHPGGIPLSQAVVGPAGNMTNFRYLVHAAVLDKYDFNPLFLLRLRHRTHPSTLASATLSSLVAADEHGLSGVVFTPMGAGIGGMPDPLCASTMIGAMREFERLRASSRTREVVIACLSATTARVFQQTVGP